MDDPTLVGGLVLRDGEAEARDGGGAKIKAKGVFCGKCGGSFFGIFFVEIPGHAQAHQHLQCVDCGTSYCDGTCTAAPGPVKTYELIDRDGAVIGIKCLRCGLTSHNPNDVANLYCGHCHQWHSGTPPEQRT